MIAVTSAGSFSYVKRSDDIGDGDGTSNAQAQEGFESYEDEHKDYYHHPSYKFEYGVNDPKTGDHKSHWEHRDGDIVRGEYTLDEADGTKRVVEYHADGKSGFHAIVKKIGHAQHHKTNYGHDGY